MSESWIFGAFQGKTLAFNFLLMTVQSISTRVRLTANKRRVLLVTV